MIVLLLLVWLDDMYVGVMFGADVCDELVFFLMIRRPPISTQSRSSAASDVYKRQGIYKCG